MFPFNNWLIVINRTALLLTWPVNKNISILKVTIYSCLLPLWNVIKIKVTFGNDEYKLIKIKTHGLYFDMQKLVIETFETFQFSEYCLDFFSFFSRSLDPLPPRLFIKLCFFPYDFEYTGKKINSNTKN